MNESDQLPTPIFIGLGVVFLALILLVVVQVLISRRYARLPKMRRYDATPVQLLQALTQIVRANKYEILGAEENSMVFKTRLSCARGPAKL